MRKFALLLAMTFAMLPAPNAVAQSAINDVEAKVSAKLVEVFGDDAKAIRVTYFDRKVILTGRVVERATQELAEEVALYFYEVADVDNQIKAEKDRSLIKGQLEDESLDAALETEAKAKLSGEIGAYAKDVNVEACEGVVALRGTVPDETRRKLALDAISGMSRVSRVIDLLRVK